jgi:hypothetical protein
MFSHALAIICICPTTWIIHAPEKLPALRDSVTQVCRDLEFGNSQFQHFVTDHADTAPVFKSNPKLKWTLIWHFAGDLKGNTIYWDNRESKSRVAGHLPLPSGHKAVRIKRNQTAIDKCATLLFELLNRKVDREYEELLQSSPDKRKSKEEFVENCLRQEYEASKEVQWFFRNHPIAGATPWRDPYYCNIVFFPFTLSEYTQFLKVQYNNNYNPLIFYDVVYRFILRNQKALLTKK